jgi:hypothetical protein
MTLNELLKTAKENLLPLTTVAEADFILEQAEYNKLQRVWEIVVSFLVDNTNKKTNPLAASSVEPQFNRLYKKVKISSRGQFIGFYIYNNNE